VTIELIQGLLLAFAIVVIIMPGYIRLLRHVGFGKQIREEGPDTHFVKQGTPTMGGLLVIVVVISVFFLLRGGPDASTFAPLAAIAGVGILGAFDDYLNARTGEGIRVRQKLIWQVVVAFFAAWQIQRTYAITAIAVPLSARFRSTRRLRRLPPSRCRRQQRGESDGRSRRPRHARSSSAFVSFMIIALLNVPSSRTWRSSAPRDRGSSGSSGSTSPGAGIHGRCRLALARRGPSFTALITGQILVLPLIGLIFVVETASDIIQIGYFRLSGGKRIFRMAPLHHHFELGGWDEEKITLRFWIVAVLAGLLGVTLFLASIKAI
jgi:phospho-N-acetylmuramoyl-pentapeptide-transferase